MKVRTLSVSRLFGFLLLASLLAFLYAPSSRADDDCQKRTATDDEIEEMQGLVRDGMKAGALGVSVSRNQGHFDPQGVHIPALWADEKEIFAIGDVDPTLIVAGNIVDQIELPRIGTRLAPGEQEFAVGRILVNAGVGIAVGDVNIALR